MLMIVFGAGASYDSVPSYPASDSQYRNIEQRLPLANQLFENRTAFANILNQYPQCKPIIPYLRHLADGKSVEQIMQRLQAEAPQDPQRYKQLAAIRYYIQHVIRDCEAIWISSVGDITNHITLLDQIRHFHKADEQVCIVTFNYDMLLEKAFQTIGVNISKLPDYINDKDYKLIKAHGSVNWMRQADLSSLSLMDDVNINGRDDLIQNIENLSLRSSYRLIDDIPHSSGREGIYWIPAIAVPIETKTEFECPNEHLRVLQEMIPHVDKILTIGWRATEKHFLKLVADNLGHDVKRLAVAESEASAEATIRNLAQAGIKGEFELSGNGFTNFVVQRQAEKFLQLS
jgi:hypothetical protein